ncbi:MAG: SpoIID/LytB domain-containing protein, partial [Thermodesulfobacteriota bacterium]
MNFKFIQNGARLLFVVAALFLLSSCIVNPPPSDTSDGYDYDDRRSDRDYDDRDYDDRRGRSDDHRRDGDRRRGRSDQRRPHESPPYSARNRGELIRIQVLNNVREITVTGARESDLVVVERRGFELASVNDASANLPLRLTPYRGSTGSTGVEPLYANNRPYHGTLEVVVNYEKGGGLQLINELPLEDYLVGLI